MDRIEEFLERQLCTLLDAEHKIVRAILRMAAKCQNPELVQVLEEYGSFSQRRVDRLHEVFDQAGVTPQRLPSAGVNGLITEFSDFLEEEPSADLLDLYAVESARRVERYAICAYQAVITLTVALNMEGSTELIAQNLAEHNRAGDGFKALSINLTERALVGETKQRTK